MCLVVYSDVLPRMIHDSLMKAVESDIGQNAKEVSEVLHRTFMSDGRKLLEVLHREGMIKKIPTNQVLITPNNRSSVRLDELNGILNEMAQGEAAINRLAELDKNAGMSGKKARPADPREVGMPMNSRANAQVEGTMNAENLIAGVLSDADLAAQRQSQAATMRQNAEAMLAEAARLDAEAETLNPTPAPKQEQEQVNVTRKATKTTKAPKKQEA